MWRNEHQVYRRNGAKVQLCNKLHGFIYPSKVCPSGFRICTFIVNLCCFFSKWLTLLKLAKTSLMLYLLRASSCWSQSSCFQGEGSILSVSSIEINSMAYSYFKIIIYIVNMFFVCWGTLAMTGCFFRCDAIYNKTDKGHSGSKGDGKQLHSLQLLKLGDWLSFGTWFWG